MSEGRRTVTRLVLEGLVIVVSILVAFAIDAWWDGRQEAEEYDRMVTALLAETRDNRDFVQGMVAYHEGLDAVIDTLLMAIDGNRDLGPEALHRGLFSVFSYYPVELSTTSYEGARSNPLWGELPEGIRRQIASIRRESELAFSDEIYAAHEINRLSVALDRYGTVRAYFVTGGRPENADWEGVLSEPVVESTTAVMQLLFRNTLGRLRRWSEQFSSLAEALERARVEGPRG